MEYFRAAAGPSSFQTGPRAGRRAAAKLCVYPHKNRITLNEGKLRRLDAGGEDAIVPEEPAPEPE
jgi:hypothetical protein